MSLLLFLILYVQNCIGDLNGLWQPPGKDKIDYFTLGDLWDCYGEWSAYGVGTPVVLNSGETVSQYYVPYLSAIQIYSNKSVVSSRYWTMCFLYFPNFLICHNYGKSKRVSSSNFIPWFSSNASCFSKLDLPLVGIGERMVTLRNLKVIRGVMTAGVMTCQGLLAITLAGLGMLFLRIQVLTKRVHVQSGIGMGTFTYSTLKCHLLIGGFHSWTR